MVEGFTGLPGSGKTYLLAQMGQMALKKGRHVYANFKLDGATYFSELSEVFSVREGLILVDEINLVCPSRWWNKFPPQLAYFWSQTRKFKLDIYWSAQHIDRVDKIIKEISNYVWYIWMLPFKFRFAKQYLPEKIGKEKARSYSIKVFRISKKRAMCFNTYEIINLPERFRN